MGFLKTSDNIVIDAVITKIGKDYLRKAVSGQNDDNEHVITKFALGDDEIDYGLWEISPTGSGNYVPLGDVIDNLPVMEATRLDTEIMKFFLYKNNIE